MYSMHVRCTELPTATDRYMYTDCLLTYLLTLRSIVTSFPPLPASRAMELPASVRRTNIVGADGSPLPPSRSAAPMPPLPYPHIAEQIEPEVTLLDQTP